MTTEYKNMQYEVRRLEEGGWEWTIPKLNVSGRHVDEHRAVAEAKASIDYWLQRLH
jgi:hypothetical protein